MFYMNTSGLHGFIKESTRTRPRTRVSSRTQVLITFDHQVGLGFTGSGLVDSFAPIDPGIYQLQCGDFKYAGVLTE